MVRFKASTVHVTDDLGNSYSLIGVGRMWCDGGETIEEDLEQEIHVGVRGHAPIEAQYIIVTIDSINGVKLIFRKSLTGATS